MSELSQLKRRVESLEQKLAPLIAERRDVQAAAMDVNREWYRERSYAANNLATLVAPRGGPNYSPPKSELELAAIEAGKKVADVQRRFTLAQSELDRAKAELLAEENAILYAWRHRKALHIIAMQNRGADASAEIAELREATPDPKGPQVRIHQRFKISSQTASVLQDPTLDETTVPSWLADKASGFTEWVSGLNLRARFGTESARMQWAMEQFQKMGWSAQQAAGLVASAHYESSMNPIASNYDKEGHLHFGLFQWGADRLANFARIAKERGWDTNDPMAQLRFADWELRHGTEQLAGNALLASQNAARAGYIVSHAYERPGSDVQDALRSGLAVQLANSTNITISGSQDPAKTADLIQTRMAKLDAALIREFASNVQ